MVIIKYKNEKYWEYYTPNKFFSNSYKLKLSDDDKIIHSKRSKLNLYDLSNRALTPYTYNLKNRYYDIYIENIRLFFDINHDLKNNDTSWVNINNNKFNISSNYGKNSFELFTYLPIKSFIHTFFSMKLEFKIMVHYKSVYNIILYFFQNNIMCNENYYYTIKKILGFGSYGIVLDVIDMNTNNFNENKNYALKVFNNNLNFKKNSDNEINILKKIKLIKNDNLIEYFLISKYNVYDIIVLEKIKYTLNDLINENKELLPEAIKNIINMIANGIKGLHENKIIHCDLKPENILISSLSNDDIINNKVNLKIIDFGHSVYNNTYKFFNIQTRYYRSPEVILLNNYSYPVDIWSFGCIIYELITKKPLFIVNNEIEIIQFILNNINIIPKKMINKLFDNIIKYFDRLDKKKLIQKFEIINNYIKFRFLYLNNKYLESIKNDNIIEEMNYFFDNTINLKNQDYLSDIDNIFFRKLIQKILVIDPDKRININNIFDFINNKK